MTTATQDQNRSNVSFVEVVIGARPSNSSTTNSPTTNATTTAKPTRTFLDAFLKAMSGFPV